eukprot:scaffold10787_cov115-Amphora_coffeaeformis.AAC.1
MAARAILYPGHADMVKRPCQMTRVINLSGCSMPLSTETSIVLRNLSHIWEEARQVVNRTVCSQKPLKGCFHLPMRVGSHPLHVGSELHKKMLEFMKQIQKYVEPST